MFVYEGEGGEGTAINSRILSPWRFFWQEMFVKHFAKDNSCVAADPDPVYSVFVPDPKW